MKQVLSSLVVVLAVGSAQASVMVVRGSGGPRVDQFSLHGSIPAGGTGETFGTSGNVGGGEPVGLPRKVPMDDVVGGVNGDGATIFGSTWSVATGANPGSLGRRPGADSVNTGSPLPRVIAVPMPGVALMGSAGLALVAAGRRRL